MKKDAKIPYRHEELRAVGPQRTFRCDELNMIAFPVGGIGTGTISVGGRGNLRDFEIFNRPAKGQAIGFTFFALWTKEEGRAPVARVLEGKISPPYPGGSGDGNSLKGLPRFAEAEMYGEYPFCHVRLSDETMPVRAELTAWNPMIPLNVKDSALPVAIFEWTLTNTSPSVVELSLAASTSNPVQARDERGNLSSAGSVNAYHTNGDLKGIFLSNPRGNPDEPSTGTLALSTAWDDVQVQTRWYRGGWWDKSHLFWDRFSADGSLAETHDAEPTPGSGDVCSIAMRARIAPGETVTIPVYYTWHFPIMENPWPHDPQKDPKTLKTYVSAHWTDAWDVARYVSRNMTRLRIETNRWKDTIFGSTMPSHVLEAITSQASIMRSPTCFLLADGFFFGWEGCRENGGCCPGSCTHVWNYEQAVAFLYPMLERTMRKTEFLYNTRESGHMGFRTRLPLGAGIWDMKPCADGQMGTIMQVYRDWKLSGDDDFLREVWPAVKRALEYAWTMRPENRQSWDSIWDLDKDGVIEGEQHNTYDIEFFGPNTMCTVMYLGALRACEEMARYLGEQDKATEYRYIYESGWKKVEAELWNGDYYIQKVKVIPEVTVPDHLKTPTDISCEPTCPCKQSPGGKSPALSDGDVMPKYQYGDGCLSDQLLGQWAAHVYGLGYLLEREHVKKTLKSIYDYNFRSSFADFHNVQRVYALNDEAGLLLCSWPKGNRPALPFVYSDEVWTGIEYHVAAHLIYEGWIDEGLAIVKAVRERYAGYNRNPWDEIECGHHYARAMSSWSVKLALDGFTFSLPEQRLGFAPRLFAEDYRTFWSTGTAWGAYTQRPGDGDFALEVLYGSQKIKRLDLADLKYENVRVTGPDGPIAARVESRSVLLDHPVVLKAGQVLRISRT